jgi:hypothetical protein
MAKAAEEGAVPAKKKKTRAKKKKKEETPVEETADVDVTQEPA